MSIHLAFGSAGSPVQWFLPGTDSSVLPEPGLMPAPVANAILPNIFRPVGNREFSVNGGDVLIRTTGFGTVTEHTVVDVVGEWNSVKNGVVFGADAANLTFTGFVHVDVSVGFDSETGSIITVLGAKRGNVVTGAGADFIDVQVVTNGADWINEFRIVTDGGDDIVHVLPFDAAAAAAAGDATFGSTTNGAGTLRPTYDGSLTRSIVDLGTGEDRYESIGQIKDLVRGGDGNDIIVLGGGNDAAFGGSGNDTLDGGVAADTLEGGRGDDLLLGGDGDDVLTGGQGSNLFQGGTGADRFVIGGLFERAGALSIVVDFAGSENDRLDVSQMGVSSFASVHINVVNGDTDSLLTFGSATSINLGSVLVVGHTTLSAMDFIFAT
jgi:Ca2+-binding RTX toxin-like protein